MGEGAATCFKQNFVFIGTTTDVLFFLYTCDHMGCVLSEAYDNRLDYQLVYLMNKNGRLAVIDIYRDQDSSCEVFSLLAKRKCCLMQICRLLLKRFLYTVLDFCLCNGYVLCNNTSMFVACYGMLEVFPAQFSACQLSQSGCYYFVLVFLLSFSVWCRIFHTVIVDDPYDDPAGLEIPDKSPGPTKEMLEVF